MSATATNITIQPTREIMKLNFMTDQGSTLDSTSWASRRCSEPSRLPDSPVFDLTDALGLPDPERPFEDGFRFFVPGDAVPGDPLPGPGAPGTGTGTGTATPVPGTPE